ncbi:uncharacterized protein LOC100163130 isoform X1 [Acyrthosiphon pisum]|uniref:Suppressor of forked domain-containing protein n=1 Tax=Acyrthosiphon pisum TaxID=7029 RepID=A0A8R2JV47_ACYPI|nr:uncharacterized protein LOC100163130 isoform X1 [Acyrthosiphon pisum]
MRPPATVLLDGGFEWDVTPCYFSENSSESEDSDKDEDNEASKKKMRKLKFKNQWREEKKQREIRNRKLEAELIQIERDPLNPDHYERLLLDNPGSSFIWMKYMAFYLHTRNLETARATAKRALTTIDAREEIEKLNVWTALLIAEELYGNKESFKQTMNEALRSNDEYMVYIKILEIFEESNVLKGLDKFTSKIITKFSDSLDAYLRCAIMYFRLNKSDQARLILQKAISNLPTKSHVIMISKFALLENHVGSKEEAQTLFEHVLTCYPSRINVLSLYVDMLVKSNKIDLARRALERATTQTLAPKKMNSLFNKWLKLEKKYGTSESVDKVKICMNNKIMLQK